MKRFLIGQFDKFDENKQAMDFRDYFWGIEVNQMESLHELERLKENINKRNLKIGIHFPILKNQWRARDPQYLSKDSKTYEESINYMDKEFTLSEEFNPDYILLHYPKPAILDENCDWYLWNAKVNSTEHYPALKSLKAEEGWGDMEAYFKALNETNSDYKVLFEHRSDLISDEELEECVEL